MLLLQLQLKAIWEKAATAFNFPTSINISATVSIKATIIATYPAINTKPCNCCLL